jgi:hypothetical protein
MSDGDISTKEFNGNLLPTAQILHHGPLHCFIGCGFIDLVLPLQLLTALEPETREKQVT